MRENKNKYIYLDHAAGTPMDPGVFKTMRKFLMINWANPSALHQAGLEARAAIENARKNIAHILGAQKEEIIFTSGGTESNNLAILGALASSSKFFSSCALPGVPGGTLGDKKNRKTSLPHIVTTNIEHPSVLEVCRHLEKTKQADVTYVPVEPNGIVDPKKIKEAIKPNTVLVSVMYANNEIGTIQPIMEIAKGIRHYRKISNSVYPYFHIDAVQAMNYLPVKVDKLGVDLLSLNGSKIYGPKGTGVLYKKRNVNFSPQMYGGSQEFGLKPGTENVAGIVGLARALKITEEIKEKESKRLIPLRDYFIDKLKQFKNVIVNGDLRQRLPNNINISVTGIESDLLVIEFDAHAIAVSSKSACKSDDPEESYVIKALRPLSKIEEGSIRFSLGRNTKKADIDCALRAFKDIFSKLKKWYN